jgi:hypothetical protein
MGNAGWVREALLGREIVGVNGERAAITDFGPTGAILESRDSGQTHIIAMQELTAAIQLWGRLRRAPAPAELSGLSIGEAEVPFVVPLIVVLREAPQVQDWLQGVRQTMGELH